MKAFNASGLGMLLIIAALLFPTSCQRIPIPLLSPSEPVATRGVFHTVEKGQTLWRICKVYGVSIQYVAEINDIQDPSRIGVGQRIFIPGAKRLLKVIPHKEWKEKTGRIRKKRGRFQWPLKGKVTSSFGIRGNRKHNGIDIAATRGTPVRSAAAGRILFRGTLKGYGKLIIIGHGDGYHTVYAHLDRWIGRQGQWVNRGQKIGTVGNTGRSKGYHLHFEIRYKNKARNPLFYLP